MRRKTGKIALLVLCAVLAAALCACGDGQDTPPVSGETLAFAEETYAIDRYDRITLQAVVRDADGNGISGRTVTYASSDETVASVDGDVLTALRAGTAVLTARSGELTATAALTVAEGQNVPRIEFGITELSILEGTTFPLEPTVTFKGESHTDATFTYETANAAVASVSEDGTVTAEGYGQTAITVTATWRGTTGGVDLTEELPVRVNENASLRLEAERFDLYTYTLPDEAGIIASMPIAAVARENNEVIENAEITWEFETAGIASVTGENGDYVINGLAAGETRVRASYVTTNGNTLTTEYIPVSVAFPVVDKTSSLSLLISLETPALAAGDVFADGKAITRIEDITGTPQEIGVSDGALDAEDLAHGVRTWRIYNADYAFEAEVRVATAVIGDADALDSWLTKALVTEAGGTTYYDGYFELSDDIDYGGNTYAPTATAWPGGNAGFRGVFDGRGHTIYNIVIDHWSGLFVGLSPGEGTVGTVRNVAFDVMFAAAADNLPAPSLIGAFNNGCIENMLVTVRSAAGDAHILSGTMSTPYARGTVADTIVWLDSSVGDTLSLVEDSDTAFNANSTVDNVYVIGAMTDPVITGVTVVPADEYDGAGMAGFGDVWDFSAEVPAFATTAGWLADLYAGAADSFTMYGGDSETFVTAYVYGQSDIGFTAVDAEENDCSRYVSLDGNRISLGTGFAQDFTVTITLTSGYFSGISAEITVYAQAVDIETLSPAEYAIYGDSDETSAFTLVDARLSGVTITGVSVWQNETWTAAGISAAVQGTTLTISAEDMAELSTGDVRLRFTGDNNAVYDLDLLIKTKVIRSAAELARLLQYAADGSSFGGYFELGGNIDFGGETYDATVYGGSGWNSSDTAGFRGTFDGKGYTVYNMTIGNSAGLFGGLGTGGVVRNTAFYGLTLTGTGASVIGAFNFGTVDNVNIWAFDTSQYTSTVYLVCDRNRGTISDSAFIAVGSYTGAALKLYTTDPAQSFGTVSGSVFVTDLVDGGYPDGLTQYTAEQYRENIAALRDGIFTGYETQYWALWTVDGKARDELPLFATVYSAAAAMYASDALAVNTMQGASVSLLPAAVYALTEVGQLPEEAGGDAVLDGNTLTVGTEAAEAYSFTVPVRLKIVTSDGAYTLDDTASYVTVNVAAIQRVELAETRYDQNGGAQTAAFEISDEVFSDMSGAAVTLSGSPLDTAVVADGKLTVSAAAMNALTGGQYTINVTGGAKSVDCPVLVVTKVITTAAELKELLLYTKTSAAAMFDGYVELGAPIDFGGETYDFTVGGQSGASGWPSSGGGTQGFRGTFDGKGYTISNIAFGDCAGLFSGIGLGGVVRNVAFENVAMSGTTPCVIGALNYGTIENVLIEVASCVAGGAFTVATNVTGGLIENCIVVAEAGAAAGNVINSANGSVSNCVLIGGAASAAGFAQFADFAVFAASENYGTITAAFNGYWSFADGVPTMSPAQV